MGQWSSRQKTISAEVSDPRMRNWMCANLALRETSNILAKFVHSRLPEMHKRMLKLVGSSTFCKFNCSKKDAPWCMTCDRWRKEILAVCDPNYKSRISWSRLNSAQWPVNPYEVARAFIPKAHRLYYKCPEFHEDFRFSLSFLQHCTEIPLSKIVCEKAWQCRAKAMRKSGLMGMRIGNAEFRLYIDVMVEILSVPEFGNTEPTIEKLRSLLRVDDEEDGSCLVM